MAPAWQTAFLRSRRKCPLSAFHTKHAAVFHLGSVVTRQSIQDVFLPDRRPLSLLLLAFTVLAVLHPFFYLNTFSGDAEIHIVYAKNFLDGYPLQFNPGQPSSGQTSMGFMFIVIAFMKLLGYPAAALSMKLIGLCSLYVIAVQTFRISRLLGLSARWSLLAGIATLLMPGSVYNGMLGSENAFFGALALSWLLLALQRGWLSAERPPGLADDMLLAALMGAMFWIRPETIPFGGIAWAVRGAHEILVRRRLEARLISRGLLFAAIAGALALAYVLLFQFWAGVLPFGAGYARLFESRDVDSHWVMGLAINTKVVKRLVVYVSVLLPAFYVLFFLTRRITQRPERWLLILLGCEFFGFMALYSLNAITALHFARYSIPEWPLGMVLASYGLWHLARSGAGRLMVAAALVAFLGAAVLETSIRSSLERDTLMNAMTAPDTKVLSERYLVRFGNPPMRPVVIAAQEVQLRSSLDDRFVIRSLDGILDAIYLNYLCHGYNDHDGYFIDQKVDFLESPFANYNHDRGRWSLSRLDGLSIGRSITRPGIRYTKIAPGEVKVTRLVAHSQDRAIQPCRIDSTSPYY
jgi:hypothetical protein